MSTSNPTGGSKEKRKLTGWRLQVGGGYDHQFFNNAELDRLALKEEKWLDYIIKRDMFYEGKLAKNEFD
jgi:adenosinetriphosphatase